MRQRHRPGSGQGVDVLWLQEDEGWLTVLYSTLSTHIKKR